MKLEIGYNHPFEIRKERYESDHVCNFSVLYISDLHLTVFSKDICTRLSKCIQELNPTIIILGGDYIDCRNGWDYLSTFFKFLSARKNVFSIAGNHDYFYGIDEIKKLIESNNIHWLENQSAVVNIQEYNILLTGNNETQSSIPADFNILCLHKPVSLDAFKIPYHIAFAGHLHGCQCVFWQNENGLYPGRFFYTFNFLRRQVKNCLYLISKGLGDTLPIRFNCKKDIIFVEIKNNSNK
ncbi:metallophosphoesterase [Cytophaga hutchinsonii]|uniref:Calcineurin-like phosphoesterase domain-containing protein n=1 Tax=Cytophaga hutchinsonii (strain ATCC 33406 / DSM 1761 / CIP 103989 / NBRC 15051 / NCIMB 9469 / D465) TaxID=269798 RepID=A0A6N4SN34_CYTH3|nr:metallophosphoesterase [Cytophaga hutchinsonii]ABG57695.1 conserved hypothetical protein [Cytophaga hutchinsonii ATCC 33406]SFX03178.1 Predicted phosphohydrolase, MPP superfamily [Cytophaga hutchinsonii ATCC 33406]